MKILYHHRTQAEDGQAVHIRSLIRAFEALGHEVWEVGLVRHGREAPAATAAPETGRARWEWVTRLPRFGRELAEYGYNGIARRRIVGEAAKFEPAFLYERYAFGNAAGVLASRRISLPMMLEVNAPMVLELSRTRGLSFPGLARKVENWIFRSADRISTVSGVLRDMLIAEGVEAERISVIHNGVDLERFDWEDRALARTRARRELGLASEREGGDDLVLGFVGYYRSWHRLDLALRAMREKELERARLVLIGEGPAREELELLAEELGVGDRLHFAGVRSHAEIPSLLPAFDVALMPAINPYASALKLHEYMAASLPVVAPDQANLREIIVSEENGLLIDSGDEDALGAAVVRLAGDRALRERLGARGRATIVERDGTWLGNARQVIEVMEKLVR
jgi:glycosyltransferase involved in cell wall biosynthesis